LKVEGYKKLQLRYAGWQNKRRIANLARQVAAHSPTSDDQPPVVMFNASTRLTNLSLNAAFSLLTGWGLRLAGAPVIHFVCQEGMSHCVLGTNRTDYTVAPPCATCLAQSRRLYSEANAHWFNYQCSEELTAALQELSVDELSQFEYPSPNPKFDAKIPLGSFILPSIRWALRRHTLPDDAPTRYLLREYILSAYNVAEKFAALLAETKPRAAVIFNGIMYPEATARWAARQLGVRAITHEVGFQQFSTFFTEGQATAYPIHIPDDFELSPEQNARLDAYLENRFQGKFTMAGIQFWPEMHGLDQAFLEHASHFQQIVPVFTNVVYDTSQVHANTIFPQMFAWLDLVLSIIRRHPETLFIIRAHPDEMRPGTAKQSNESVRDWVHRNQVDALPNVKFIDSQEYISSYELIQRAKFLIVYNSSIGLEAALMGKPVVCGGKARYTQYPTVYLPKAPDEYAQKVEDMLEAGSLHIPEEFRSNARRFLYYQLFRASLPLDDYLQTGPRPGFVQLRAFSWKQLTPENSSTMRILVDGIVNQKPFLLPEN
jgi:hypothetical protein